MAVEKSPAAIAPPYGVVIQEALERNDPAEMARVAIAAQEYLAHADQVKFELEKLNARLSDDAAIVPYGTAIHEAIKSGDKAHMQKVALAAEAHLKRVDAIRDALQLLEAEIDDG